MSLVSMIIADRAAPFSRYYDLWMRIITWGRDGQIRKAALDHIQPGDRVLDVGCGTGSLAVLAAKRGAKVIALDISPHMLALARRKADEHGVEVSFLEGQAHPQDSKRGMAVEGPFDVVAATFTLSEISPDEAECVLFEMASRLKMGGKMILADESRPTNPLMRLFSGIQRAIAWFVTFVFLEERPTRLHDLRGFCHQFNLEVVREARYLGGSLHLVVAEKRQETPQIEGVILEPLLHTGVKGLFIDALLWAAPLPLAVKSGLYRLGEPKGGSPLFLTSNFYMTFKKVVEGLRGLDCYLLVEDTEGWNVWCAADAGIFTAEKAAALMRAYRLGDMLTHETIVLPGLGSKIGSKLKQLTGWEVVKGPLYARDLPGFIERGYRLSKEMRLDYTLPARLRVGVMSALFSPLWALPLLIEGWGYFWGFALFGVLLSFFLSLFHYLLPGKTGVVKGGFMGLLVALGLLGWRLASTATIDVGFGLFILVLVLYSVLFGWNYQSVSPVIFWKRLF